LMERWQSG